MRTLPRELIGAMLAAKFAREIGLPYGNLWEPGITRGIQEFADSSGLSVAEIEEHFRVQFGLRWYESLAR